MKMVEVELEKVIEDIKELIQISIEQQIETEDDWSRGYAYGAEAAYDDTVEKISEVLRSITGASEKS